MNSTKNFNWKLFYVLWAGAFLGLLAVIPYVLTLQSAKLEQMVLPMSIEMIITIQLIVNSLFIGLLTGLGLFLANKYGLGAPFIEKLLNGQKTDYNFRNIIVLSLISGATIAFIIQGLDAWIFDLGDYLKHLGIVLPDSIHPESWKGLLASLYGGITEEVLLRLFMLTAIVWLAMFISKNKTNQPSLTILWLANILAAVIFGLGHLPATVALGAPLDLFVISRAVILNGLGGICFGWLYFRYGLESAMIAHFSADIVLHVIM